MNLQHRVSSPPLGRLVFVQWRMKHPAPPSVPCAFDAALASCTRQDYAGAFDALARLADAGQRPSARIALLLAEHGARRYGHRFEASADTRRRWQALADTAGEAA